MKFKLHTEFPNDIGTVLGTVHDKIKSLNSYTNIFGLNSFNAHKYYLRRHIMPSLINDLIMDEIAIPIHTHQYIVPTRYEV